MMWCAALFSNIFLSRMEVSFVSPHKLQLYYNVRVCVYAVMNF